MPDDPSVLVGHVIAERYRVDAVLGRGGMGAVLRCHHLGLRRDVAVKLLHPELAGDREIAARFEREAASASRLDHPNCVRVLDFGVWQPNPGMPPAKYLAMQLLEGQELAALLGRPLPPSRAVALMQQILAALEHAHGHGVVHRDLKPENIFVTRDHDGSEQLKLVDFGIAKISEGEEVGPKLTRVGVVFGTPLYMSPEQAAGGVVDARTDLYAAGVILFEMLAGMPPFLGDDATTLLRKHLFEDPPALSEALPAPLRVVVRRLLEKDRADRFASATEVRAALAALDAPSAGAPPVTWPDASRMTMRAVMSTAAPRPVATSTRRAWWIAGGIGVVGIVVVGIVVVASLPRDEPVAPSRPPTPPSVAPAASAAPVVTPPVFVPMPVFGASPSAAAAPQAQRARTLAATEGKGAEALAAFAAALDHDPTLLEDRDAAAELFALVRRPELREAAVGFAIDSLGDRALPLLVEFVHAPTPVLGHAPRHRALDRIREDAVHGAMIDGGLQRSLDLWQASQTPTPCVTFASGLDAIAREPTPDVLGTLHRVSPPVAPADADPATSATCALLPTRLAVLRAQVLAAHPVPAAQWTVPPAYAAPKKKPKKRGVLRRLFGG